MERNKRDWIQIGILIVAIGGFAYGVWQQSRSDAAMISSRFARLEQRMDDSDKDRVEMMNTLYRIEDKLK